MTAKELDSLIEEITTDGYGDDEQLRAFHCAFEDGIELPCDAFVIGEPVSVVGFDYDGNPRRGLVARCLREDGSEHRVSASELVLAFPDRRGACQNPVGEPRSRLSSAKGMQAQNETDRRQHEPARAKAMETK